MASFSIAYPIVQGNEGWSGVVARDNNGALVRYGVNQAAFPGMPAGFYDGSMDNSTALEAAQGHYRAVEWAGVMGDQIEDQTLANHLLDMAVNAGVAGAVRTLQAVLVSCGESLALDGAMGPQTLAAANARIIAPLYRAARAGYYTAESFTATGRGWLPDWLGRLAKCG